MENVNNTEMEWQLAKSNKRKFIGNSYSKSLDTSSEERVTKPSFSSSNISYSMSSGGKAGMTSTRDNIAQLNPSMEPKNRKLNNQPHSCNWEEGKVYTVLRNLHEDENFQEYQSTDQVDVSPSDECIERETE